MLPVLMMLNRMSSRMQYRAAKQQQIEKNSAPIECCRTCLSTDNLKSIFINKESRKKRSNDLKLITGLEIQYNDGLSQKICSKCLEMLQMALKFRQTSRKALKKLIGIKHTAFIGLEKRNRPKVEIEILNNDDYNCYQDDFQNDDFIEQKPKKLKVIKKPALSKSKRTKMPVATIFKCNICSKEFRMKATYKSHMRFHTNYCVCESCGKRCRNNNQLQEHKRARHGLGRIHKCAFCEYSAATKEALTIHERRHTGERPYICDHCGANFHRRSNLVQHIAIHLPEKNFQCDMCPKRLKSKKFLQIHKHNAHTGKRYGYLCPVCDHRFEKPNKVRAHTRRVHGLPDDQHGPIIRVQL